MGQHEDYLKRRIDQLGRVLGKLVSELIGLKADGKLTDGVEMTDQVLNRELDFDLQKLLDIPTDSFVDTLKMQKSFNNESLDNLADVLLLFADEFQDKRANLLYERCLAIYEHLDKTDPVYSLEREWKIKRIRNLLFRV